MSARWKHFESVSEYSEFCAPLEYLSRLDPIGFRQGIEQLKNGWLEPLEEINSVLAEMQDQQVFAPHMPLPRASLIGNQPRIAALLAGHPKTMSRRIHDPEQALNTPLKIYVETTVQARITAHTILNRGIAVMAFVMAMRAIRPVELYVVSMSRIPKYRAEVGLTVKIDPNDMGAACAMLCSPALSRGATWAAKFAIAGGTDSLLWRWNVPPNHPMYIKNVKQELEVGTEDIYIHGGDISDMLLATDPIQWVKNMIELHNVRQFEVN